MFEGLFETISSGLLWAAAIAAIVALAYWAYKEYIAPDDKGTKQPSAEPERQRQQEVAPERQKVLSVDVNTPLPVAKNMTADDQLSDKTKKQLGVVLDSIPNTNATVGTANVATALNKIKAGQADRYAFLEHTNYKNLRAIAGGTLENAQAYFPDMKQPEFDAFKNIVDFNKKRPEGDIPNQKVYQALRKDMDAATVEKKQEAAVVVSANPVPAIDPKVAGAATEAVTSIRLPAPPPEGSLINMDEAFKVPDFKAGLGGGFGTTSPQNPLGSPSENTLKFNIPTLGASPEAQALPPVVTIPVAAQGTSCNVFGDEKGLILNGKGSKFDQCAEAPNSGHAPDTSKFTRLPVIDAENCSSPNVPSSSAAILSDKNGTPKGYCSAVK